MEQGTVTTQPLGQSFIIKRPRLTKLLDESGARIILLVAPAGYGKTTLAREWVAVREGVVWYSGRPAMADVAALASGLAATLAVDDDSAAAATARLRILASRGQPPDALARAVATGVATVCSTLVIDDCHYAAGSYDSNVFLSELIKHTEFRVLLTSRVRPEWITTRMIVYGEVATVEMSELAFTDDEARAIINEASDNADDGLLSKAQGWPAVIGLAAQRRGPNLSPTLPADELYDFFAEDLFQHAPAELQKSLILLALGGDTDVTVCKALFEPDHERVLTMAAEHGFISLQRDETRIHPLLRGFLLTKLHALPPDEVARMARAAIDVLASRGLWDECLAVLECAPLDDLVASVLNKALVDLLDSGRIATVRQWLALARLSRVDDPILLLAEAEIALRDQNDAKAQVLGERAGDLISTGDTAARAYIVAARAAHLRDDRAAVGRNSKLALSAAAAVNLQTTALWIEFANAVEWSALEAKATLDRLRDLPDARPDHALRVLNAEGWLLMDAESDLRAAAEKFELAKELLPHVRDPFLTTGLLNVFAHIMVLLAQYDRALLLVDELIEDAESNGVEFAVDHALVTRASAYIGLRKFLAAEKTLREIDERSPNATAHVAANARLQHVRLLIAAGDLERSLSLMQLEPPDRLPLAFRGEFHAYRGLVLAALADTSRAEQAFRKAHQFAGYITITMLSDLGRAVVELQQQGDAASERSVEALTSAMSAGHLDSVVTAARAFPDLIRAGASDDACVRALTETLSRSGDVDLGRRAGLQMPRELRRSEGLSPRESDVYELMVRGRTNKEIARTLFISESTTKVHVRHIFEKLGVHTRTEAATALIDVRSI